MRNLLFFLFFSLCSASVFVSAATQTFYYGIYQSKYSSSGYTSLSGDEYNRQNYDYISSIMRSTAARNYGYPLDNGEQWRFELRDQTTDALLSSITYEAQDYCLYGNVDDSGWFFMGCIGDPYQFYMIGTFYTKCLDTANYYIKSIHGNAIDAPFKPTDFTPAAPTIAALNDVTPSVPDSPHPLGTIPGYAAGVVDINVEVKDNEGCGKPLPNIKVELENTIVEQSGSHLHFTGSTNGGTGRYTASSPSWTAINTSATGITVFTDGNGAISASYQAGIYGVTEQLEATAHDPVSGTTRSSTAEYDIRVPGLVSLDTVGTYHFRGSYTSDCDVGHNDSRTSRRSHYATPFTRDRIAFLNSIYETQTGNPLCLNDASLEFGGFFDAGKADRAKRCHISHRLGVDIDVNTQPNFPCTESLNTETTDYNGVTITKVRFLDLVANRLHGWKAEEPSLHYRFSQ